MIELCTSALGARRIKRNTLNNLVTATFLSNGFIHSSYPDVYSSSEPTASKQPVNYYNISISPVSPSTQSINSTSYFLLLDNNRATDVKLPKFTAGKLSNKLVCLPLWQGRAGTLRKSKYVIYFTAESTKFKPDEEYGGMTIALATITTTRAEVCSIYCRRLPACSGFIHEFDTGEQLQ